LKNDREVVTAAVLQDGEALCFANEDLKRDAEVVFTVVIAALKQTRCAQIYMSDRLRNDPEVQSTQAIRQW